MMDWHQGEKLLEKPANGLRALHNLYDRYKTKRELLNGIKPQPQLNDAVTVIFNPVRSTPIFFDVELFLGYQLALRGVTVKILVDDGIMKHWDYEQLQHVERGQIFDPYRRLACDRNSIASTADESLDRLLHRMEVKLCESAYSHKNLDVISYSDLIDGNTDGIEITKYDRNQALSSTKRYFESGIIDLENSEHQAYFQKSIKNCLVSKQVGKQILNRVTPDLFVTSHGIYSTWEPCCRVMKDEGVETLIWDVHFSKRKKIILADDIIQLISNDSEWQQKKEQALDKSSQERVTKIFTSRLNHNTLDTEILFGGFKDARKIDFANNLKDDGIVFGLFPNVGWDGNIYERNKMFDDLIEWIEFTIDKIKETNNTLIIRFHPTEATLQKGAQQLEEILVERNGELKNFENITLISAGATVDTYALAKEHIDIGLIYSGTLAMELTFLGIPVISCSNSFYHRAGFCFEPECEEEYANMLLNAKETLTTYQKKKELFNTALERFAHWYFFDAAYELPIFDPEKLYAFQYDKLDASDIDPRENDALAKTIAKLINKATRGSLNNDAKQAEKKTEGKTVLNPAKKNKQVKYSTA